MPGTEPELLRSDETTPITLSVKDGSFSLSSLEWKSVDSINGISYSVNKC